MTDDVKAIEARYLAHPHSGCPYCGGNLQDRTEDEERGTTEEWVCTVCHARFKEHFTRVLASVTLDRKPDRVSLALGRLAKAAHSDVAPLSAFTATMRRVFGDASYRLSWPPSCQLTELRNRPMTDEAILCSLCGYMNITVDEAKTKYGDGGI